MLYAENGSNNSTSCIELCTQLFSVAYEHIIMPAESPVRFFDINGKETNAEDRYHNLLRLSDRIFDGMVTTPEIRRKYSRVESKNYREKLYFASRFTIRPQTAGTDNFHKNMLSYAAKKVRAKSAKSRNSCLNLYKNAGRLSMQQPLDSIQRRRSSSDSVKSSTPNEVNKSDAGNKKQDGELQQKPDSVDRSDSDDESSECSCSSHQSEEAVKERKLPFQMPPSGKITLKVAVADFTRKIEENEGTAISTFSFVDDSQPPLITPTHDEEEPQQENDSSNKLLPAADAEESSSKRPSFSMNTQRSHHHHRRKKKKELSSEDRFRRAVKTVNLLIKACTTKAEQTRKNQMRFMTFSDMTDSLQEQNKNTSLDFQVSHFKARREKTLSPEVQEILRLHPSMRTADMLRLALVNMQAVVETFAEFPIQMQQSLVKVGWYEKFDAKRIIIRQGHNALNYYFIISGTTVVTVASKNSVGEPVNRTVAFLRKGHSFGELALMYGGKRSATVYCKDEVELLAVNREDFIDIFMNLNAEEEPEHIRFLRTINILEHWPLHKLPYDDPRTCMFLYFRRGTVLCRDSNNSEWIYILKSGTCRIIKDLNSCSTNLVKLRSKQRISEHIPIPENSFKTGHLEFLQRDCLPIRNMHLYNPIKINPGYKKKPRSKLFIQLKVLGPKDVFGLEPIAFEIFGGTTGVTLVSDGAECVLIKKEFMLKHMNEKYYKKLREEIQPFPTIESLEEKLQGHYNWNSYKATLVDFLKYSEDPHM